MVFDRVRSGLVELGGAADIADPRQKGALERGEEQRDEGTNRLYHHSFPSRRNDKKRGGKRVGRKRPIWFNGLQRGTWMDDATTAQLNLRSKRVSHLHFLGLAWEARHRSHIFPPQQAHTAQAPLDTPNSTPPRVVQSSHTRRKRGGINKPPPTTTTNIVIQQTPIFIGFAFMMAGQAGIIIMHGSHLFRFHLSSHRIDEVGGSLTI